MGGSLLFEITGYSNINCNFGPTNCCFRFKYLYTPVVNSLETIEIVCYKHVAWVLDLALEQRHAHLLKRDWVLLNEDLARIFHEYATISLVAGMIARIVAFTQKDSLYKAHRLPNANFF